MGIVVRSWTSAIAAPSLDRDECSHVTIADYLDRHIESVRRGDLPSCKICGADTAFYDVVDLNKSCEGYPDGFAGVPVYYVRCESCGFVFTDFFADFAGADWQGVIYNARYYERFDPDYAKRRPALNAAQLDAILHGRKNEIVGLDYGGGNGRTAELLRTRGYAFDSYDPYGDTSLTSDRMGLYNFCCAFEVAEHTPEPREMMRAIVERCSSGKLIVLIGTLAQDDNTADPVRLGWWYAAPRNGHISLFTRQALRGLGADAGLDLISFNASQHVFFRGYTPSRVRRMMIAGKIRGRLKRMGLRGS